MGEAQNADIAALVEVVESGWEDEPTEAETELAHTVARNVLASEWLAERLARERAEALSEAADALPWDNETHNPHSHAVAFLRERAAHESRTTLPVRLADLLLQAARDGRRATLDPGAFVKRGRDADGAYERLDRWQERALLAALGRRIPPVQDGPR